MRILLDTNIIISAALFPKGRTAAAFYKSLYPPYEPIICDYTVDELHRKFEEKFPDRLTELDAFLYSALSVIQLVKTPVNPIDTEYSIRDEKDRPILRAALHAHAALLLTGDKDFLESNITNPKIISVSEFIDM